MKTSFLLSIIAVSASAAQQNGWFDLNRNGTKEPYEDPSKTVEVRVNDLISRMTFDEKIGQLYQGQTWKEDAGQLKRISGAKAGSYIWNLRDPALRNKYQRAAVEETRLGIPLIFGMDIIHGAETILPISLGLACSFDPGLFEKGQAIAAKEAAAEGVDWTFAPMCDTARDPRWGRVAETCGEDPWLNSLCVAAQVRGFQGKDASAQDRIAACMKHYAGYSHVTGGRDYNDANFSEWSLRNTHLRPFRACAEAGVLTVMSSFNTIDGIPAVANRHTLTEILRGEWGFAGFVVSDWGAVKEQKKWGFAGTDGEAARHALNAGNEMEMMSFCYENGLKEEVDAGRVTIATIDEAVRRVLRIKCELGLFDRPYVDEKLWSDLAASDRKADRETARECVRKSAVLVKNSGILPLRDVKRIAIIGPAADDAREMVGCWNGRNGDGRGVVTLLAGLKAALPASVALDYVQGCAMNTKPATKTLQDGRVVLDREAKPADDSLDLDKALAAANAADVVVMALGETRSITGENQSRASLSLTGRQQDLFDAVAATGKPVVAVVFSGRPLVLPQIWDKAAAVLYAWQPGSEAGNGLADVLLGTVSPSGRLSMSIPHDVSQVPAYYNHPTTGRPRLGQYKDTTERGARFPFGYGLTYSSFSYTKPQVAGNEVFATVTNTGKAEAIETAQLYIRQKVCESGFRPIRELRGLKRVSLKPGESAEVRFAITAETLAYTERNGVLVCDAGEYDLWIAPDSVSGEPVTFVR